MDEAEWAAPYLEIEKGSYTVRELIEWNEAKRLQLTPEFQRGEVWKRAAKAYLIDTILRGYPIPPLHIRLKSQRNGPLVREVIDGQQRILAILEYLRGAFALARPRANELNPPPWAGKKYSQLPEELQERIQDYSFRVEIYKGGIDDNQIREIFSRINIYSVSLSAQELRNGRYFGEFKRTTYKLAEEHVAFFEAANIFGTAAIARMLHAEFVSEALIVQLSGMQDKKNTIESYYSRYDASWPDADQHEQRFRETIDAIRIAVGDILPVTRFNRAALFYSLYSAIYHRIHGIPEQRIPEHELPMPSSPRQPLTGDAADRLRTAVQNLDERLGANEELGDDSESGILTQFVTAASRQTDNIRPRLRRLQAIWELADLSRS